MAQVDADLAELRTAEEKAALDAATKGITSYKSDLKKYVAYAESLVDKDDYRTSYKGSAYVDFDLTEASAATGSFKALYDDYAAQMDAVRNVSELEVILANAKAACANVLTTEAIQNAGKAVAATIAALPAATVANEDAIMAAQKDYKAFLKIYGALETDVYNRATLSAKMTTLKALQVAAVDNAIAKLPTTVKSDDDVAAVKAAREMYDKYVAAYKELSDTFTISKEADLITAEGKVSNYEIKLVQDAIYALEVS
jgi:hypothetical protein